VLEYLINEILEPSMIDVDGQIVLSGTPGLVPYGYFFNATQNPRFAQHRWSLRDNPHLEVTPDVFLARIRERRGITESDPGYRREYLGEWVKDENALVIKYDPHLNHYEDSELPGGKWTHVMGVDLGFVDSDAITIQGWSDRAPVVYKLAEDKRSKANLTELMGTVMEMFRKWNPIRVVVDPGGIGAKLIDELKRRHGLPCEAAEKVRKFEHIELLNDALRTGRFKAKRDSAFAEEAMRAQWDMDSRARGILKVSNAYHPDMLDADLYAFRHCAHYLFEPEAAKPNAEQQLDAWERAESERIERRKEGGWADDAAGKMGYE
jgi:phage terminase large subunit-like protein